MSDNLVKIGYLLLNCAVFLIFAWSLLIFTSLVSSVSWYEPSGMQLLAIPVFSIPVLTIFGVALLLYGKWIGASILNRSLPFLGALLLLVITFAGSGLDGWKLIAGSVVCVVCAVLVVITTIHDLYRLRGPIDYRRFVT